MTGSILCVGAAVLDTVFALPELPTRGGKYLPEERYQFAAGMASSAACTIARLGGAPSLWACVGADDAGQRVISELLAEGIDCAGVRARSGIQTAICTTLVDRQGERIIVPSYDLRLREPADWLSFDGLDLYDAILADVRWPSAAEPLLRAAAEQGVPSVLDADVAAVEVLATLAPLARYPVFSEPAAYRLSQRDTVSEALNALSARLGGFVAITAGAEGTFYREAPGLAIVHRPAPRVDVVDTLSAGDVFHGAFTLALAQGRSIIAAVDFANAAAALKCTRKGGRLGTPYRAELDAFMLERGIA